MTQATVEVLRGNKQINEFMRAAGLGFGPKDGVGYKETWDLTYKDGEIVTKERVEQALKSLKEALDNSTDREEEILSYKVLEIKEVLYESKKTEEIDKKEECRKGWNAPNYREL